jgi:hypothetical protein
MIIILPNDTECLVKLGLLNIISGISPKVPELLNIGHMILLGLQKSYEFFIKNDIIIKYPKSNILILNNIGYNSF